MEFVPTTASTTPPQRGNGQQKKELVESQAVPRVDTAENEEVCQRQTIMCNFCGLLIICTQRFSWHQRRRLVQPSPKPVLVRVFKAEDQQRQKFLRLCPPHSHRYFLLLLNDTWVIDQTCLEANIFFQSRPLTDLDSALREFRSSTAASRENLSNSRTDLSIAAVRASIASRWIYCYIIYNILLWTIIRIISQTVLLPFTASIIIVIIPVIGGKCVIMVLVKYVANILKKNNTHDSNKKRQLNEQ